MEIIHPVQSIGMRCMRCCACSLETHFRQTQVRLQACNNRTSFSGRIPAGAVLGAEGAAGPTPVAAVPVYRGAMNAYRRILTDEGVIAGLYRGCVLCWARAQVCSVCRLVEAACVGCWEGNVGPRG